MRICNLHTEKIKDKEIDITKFTNAIYGVDERGLIINNDSYNVGILGNKNILELNKFDEDLLPLNLENNEFFNNIGGFINNGREYVFAVNKDYKTPAVWSNVLSNKFFGKKAEYQGVITLWNVDTFEGGSASKTSFLENVSLKFEKEKKLN